MKNVRKPLAATIALGAALAMPMAFAQDAAQAPPMSDAPAREYAQDATAEVAQAQQGQVTWADLDTDGDGKLSRTESAALEGLALVFEDVDADGDGNVTPEEYRAYVNRQAAGAGAAQD
ncbi:EF-hand domain-containing protein [Luteimonas sp. 100069]|uniref:EF-hand domain-containing protein n=1 Tax=Luteimonas sp. 100069 TaxID=2006109 RepID=UPI000F50422C|nr:EF-hand domain-containing protein [Luteimonas sp. 100069]RPD84552.1 EF-hand domain-containing protein [Luteimonas sp. 100069]